MPSKDLNTELAMKMMKMKMKVVDEDGYLVIKVIHS